MFLVKIVIYTIKHKNQTKNKPKKRLFSEKNVKNRFLPKHENVFVVASTLFESLFSSEFETVKIA
jgi:hypothetical protein